MRDEFMDDLTINRQGIEVSFVPLNEFLDGYFHAICNTGFDDDLFQVLSIAYLPNSGGTGPGRRFDDQWVANLLGKFPGSLGVAGPG